MKIRINHDTLGNIGILTALTLAYFARSILARILFGSVTLYLFYMVSYGSSLSTILKNVSSESKRKQQRGYLHWVILLAAVMLFGLYRTGSFSIMISYTLVLLLPVIVPESLLKRIGWMNFILAVTIFVSVGCLIAYFMPSFYQASIVPMFKGSDLESIQFILSNQVCSGFISQTGYASFFLCMGLGAVYCFRKNVLSNTCALLLFSLFLFALLVTEKRGPLLMLGVVCLILFYLEGRGDKKLARILCIIAFFAVLYAILTMLTMSGIEIPGISKVYEVLSGFLNGNGIDDNGRAQLYMQALLYFRQHPIEGIGWANFSRTFTLRNTHVHNIYFQLLCETGIIGFTIFVSFFLLNLIRTIRMVKDEQQKNISYCWLKFSLYMQLFFLLYGLTGNPLYDTEDVMFYFFAVGIANRVQMLRRRKNNENSYIDLSVRT